MLTAEIDVSRDGRRAVSTSGSVLEYWHLQSGALIRSFPTGQEPITSVALSSDERSAATGSRDGTLRIWDLHSGESRSLVIPGDKVAHRGGVSRVALLAPGDRWLSSGADGAVRTWSAVSGELLAELEHRSAPVAALSASRDGQLVATGGLDGTISIFRAGGGPPIRRFTMDGWVRDVAISPDGGQIVACGMKRVAPDSEAMVEDARIWIWNVAAGTPPLRVPIESGLPPSGALGLSASRVAFSPDGATILAAGSLVQPLMLIEAATGGRREAFGELKRTPLTFPIIIGAPPLTPPPVDISPPVLGERGSPDINASTARFTQDGKYILSAGTSLDLWDSATTRRVRSFPRHTVGHVVDARFSDDGTRLFVGGDSAINMEWDVQSLRLVRSWPVQYRGVGWVALSPDGRTSIFTVFGGLRVQRDHDANGARAFDDQYPVAISGDGQRFVAGDGRHSSALLVHDLGDGHVIGTYGLEQQVTAAQLTRDGARLVGGDRSGSLVMWDVASGAVLQRFTGSAKAITSIDISRDGGRVLAGCADGTWAIWDTADAAPRVKSPTRPTEVTRVAFSPDERIVLFGDNAGTVTFALAADGRELRSEHLTGGAVSAVAFSPTGRLAVSTSYEGTARLWNTTTWASVTFVTADSEWIAFSPEGYFDASNDGSDLVAMIAKDDNAFAVDQFALRFNRPDVLLRQLGAAPLGMIEHYFARYRSRIAKAGLGSKDQVLALHVPRAQITGLVQNGKLVEVAADLGDDQVALKSYNVFVNNVPIYGRHGKPISGSRAAIKERIELTSGDNRIEISATNAAGAESFRDYAYVVYDRKVAGDLYFIGFGVSKYRDARLNLGFASKDARDLAALFTRASASRGGAKIVTYLDEQVNADAFAKAKETLRHARVDDTVIVFLAGHGARQRSADATFYFLVHDTDVDRLPATAVSMDTVEDLLQEIPPRRKLLLVDACESGDIDSVRTESDFSPGPGVTARSIRGGLQRISPGATPPREFILHRDRLIYNDLLRHSGAVVFSASRGDEYSYESTALEQGYFTRALLDVLGQAPRPEATEIELADLRSQVEDKVRRLSGDRQHPSVERGNLFLKISLPLAHP